MQITKYQHACFTVTLDDATLVIDPGNLSGDFLPPEHVVAVVITHEHADHFDHDQLAAIADKNPSVIIIGPAAITEQIEAFETRTVSAGDRCDVGPFHLAFFGGEHAVIHPSRPTVANLGVMINELLYYPGDSFTIPAKAVDTLALPVAAPWLKIGETMDFLATVKPRLAFPTHDAILSPAGQSMVDAMLSAVAAQNDSSYQRIDDQPIEV